MSCRLSRVGPLHPTINRGSGARKLQLGGNPDVGGDQTASFKPAEVFKFMIPHD